MISKVFLLGNIICALGTLLNMREVYRDRRILNGYSLLGSLLTFLACAVFQIGFAMSGLVDSVLCGLITVSYWLLVVLYLIKMRASIPDTISKAPR